MAEMRDLPERLGFADVRSLLQSGNLVFRFDAQPGARLERMLEMRPRGTWGSAPAAGQWV